MTMDDYRNLNIHAISKEAFEKLWNEEDNWGELKRNILESWR